MVDCLGPICHFRMSCPVPPRLREPRWAVMALRSGHFAGAIFHGQEGGFSPCGLCETTGRITQPHTPGVEEL